MRDLTHPWKGKEQGEGAISQKKGDDEKKGEGVNQIRSSKVAEFRGGRNNNIRNGIGVG